MVGCGLFQRERRPISGGLISTGEARPISGVVRLSIIVSGSKRMKRVAYFWELLFGETS